MVEVSVIIPIYNGEKYIKDAIDSVLNQTFQNFEIILINDGSTDKTSEILDIYNKNNKIKILNIEKNQGQASAINLGIKKSKGKYLAYLDSDDIMLENRLLCQLKYLDKHKNIGLIFSDIGYINQNGYSVIIKTKFFINKKWAKNKCNSNSLLVFNYISRSSVMHRRSCIDVIGDFDEEISGIDDLDMWIRTSEKFSIAGCQDKLTIRRLHKENISKKRNNSLLFYSKKRLIILKKAYKRRKQPFQIFLMMKSAKITNLFLSKLDSKNINLFILIFRSWMDRIIYYSMIN